MISDHDNHYYSVYFMEQMVTEFVSLVTESMENFSTMDAPLSQQYHLKYPNGLMVYAESSAIKNINYPVYKVSCL